MLSLTLTLCLCRSYITGIAADRGNHVHNGQGEPEPEAKEGRDHAPQEGRVHMPHASIGAKRSGAETPGELQHDALLL